MSAYAPLQVNSLRDPVVSLASRDHHASLEDPASTLFTDLRVAPGVIVPASEPLPTTLRLMKQAGVRMAFVSDPAGGIVGLVTAADLQGERPMLVAQARLVSHDDLLVAEVMTPISQWVTLDVDHLRRAEVGHIVATFMASGARYLIVTETIHESSDMLNDTTRTVVRGLYSANLVERALGHPIGEEVRSRSFADLAVALAHS
jgi:CBS domain containing-hemolysin-like protein